MLNKYAGLVFLIVAGFAATAAHAQDMEPRAYSASPVGLNFLAVGYNWLTGSVLLDPTLPISDVHADVRSLAIGVGHTFNMFGDLGLVTVTVPYALLDVTGNVEEQQGEARRSGMADAHFRLSVNLLGNPAASPREFATRPAKPILGASVGVIAPAGQYYDARLINIGTNRWSFKPELGGSFPKGPWDFDAYFGVWFFTANTSFYPGQMTRIEDPVLTIQGHVSYEFQPHLWVAVNGTAYRGGSTRVDGRDISPGLNNSRVGVTLSLPIASYAIKAAYSTGVTARAGANFDALMVAWQMSWLSPRWAGR